jgi:hypothetical protein
MTEIYLFLSSLSALGFYLSSTHQRFWPGATARTHTLRIAAWASMALAMAAAVAALGPWAGVFAALTMLMLALVLLPYLDAWQQSRREKPHVG